MKVLVVTNMAPFIHGAAEELAYTLVSSLREVPGISAELMRVPFSREPYGRVVDEILISRFMELANVDRVIALKFPAYLIPHECKILWILDHYRQAYDLYDAGKSNFPNNSEGASLQEVVRRADNKCLESARAIYVNSPVTKRRLLRYNRFDSTVLYPPLNDPQYFVNAGQGEYIFAGGRVGEAKRQFLLLEALKLTRSGVRLVIGGPPDGDADALRIREAASDPSISGRVTLALGFLVRAKLAEYVNNALAVAYLPFDEDSVGYITMEAFQAEKPVLTTSDSGAILEIVIEGATGLVARPEAQALAEAMDRFYLDRERTRELGRAAKDLLAKKALNWPDTIARLLS